MAAERLQVILELVTGQYKKEAREAATSTKAIGSESEKAGGGISKMSGAMKLAATAAAGFVLTRLGGFLGDAAKAAGEDDKSQRLLATALENTTGATEDQIAAVETWIDGVARATGVADDQLRPALANLVRANGDVSQSQKDLGIAMDVSAAKGLSLEAVTKAMGRAQLGNTGALGKLGVATKDAAGEALSYDEILADAARTMGGSASEAASSLAGQIERQNVAWEEQKEKLGGEVIPVQSHWLGLIQVLAAELDTKTNQSIARMNLQFNDLINSGVDPASDRVAAFVTVLGTSQQTADATTASLDMLAAMTGVTAEDFGAAVDMIVMNTDALGLNSEQAQVLVRMLKEVQREELLAARDTNIYAESIREVTGATREQIDAARELADPLFALAKASDRAKEAGARYNEEVRLHGVYSRDAYEAGIDLASAQLDVNAATATYAEEGGPASVQVLRDTLEQAGLLPDAIQMIIDKFGAYTTAAGKINNPFIGGNGAGARVGARAGGGPITAGQMYRAGEGNRPELMVIPGDNGRIFSHADTMALLRGGRDGQSLRVTINYPNHTGNDIQAAIQRAVGLAGLVHFAEVTSGES